MGVSLAPPATSTTTQPPTGRRRTRGVLSAVGGLTVAALVLAACGGGDDDDATTASTVPPTLAPVTTIAAAAPPTTLPPAPPSTQPAFVTEGATLAVANASGIDGAAGRLTDRLAVAGFTMTTATNASESVGQLNTTQIHYVAGNPTALAVAQSAKEVLGGGDIVLQELAVPAPTDSGELGPATVLVLMGNDVADRSFDELQGTVTPDDTATAGDDTSTDTATETSTGG